MNWEALGAIGELVSALGVIGTLIYLSIQIRGSTRESQLTANTEIARDYNSMLQHISSDKEMSKLWQTTIEDFDSLTPDEQTRAIMITGNIMRILENAYLQHRSGRMSLESWEGYEKLLRRGTAGSNFTTYWKLRRDLHHKEFGTLVEKCARAPDSTKLFTVDE